MYCDQVIQCWQTHPCYLHRKEANHPQPDDVSKIVAHFGWGQTDTSSSRDDREFMDDTRISRMRAMKMAYIQLNFRACAIETVDSVFDKPITIDGFSDRFSDRIEAVLRKKLVSQGP